MAQARRKKTVPAQPRQQTPEWLWAGVILVAVVFFYWIPLTDPNTSIHWDAVDVHYSSQQYFAERITRGELPFWTPYLFSGFPFLADPQVGAWYPLNWPFFLAGIMARTVQWELFFHAFLACAGAFLLLRRFAENRPAALVGAFAYGLSGFFAEHSSHVGIFQTASGLPWLLLGFDSALRGSPARNTILTGLAGGTIILAGHFQTALYSFAGLGLFAIAHLVDRRKNPLRLATILAGAAAIAALFSMIQTLPGLELTGESIRAEADFGTNRDRVLRPSALVNLFWPNATGIFSETNITDAQYYLYSGVLLVPLAVVGLLKDRRVRFPGVLMTVLPLWYMLGPDGGLYRLGFLVPGLHRVRSPIHLWFVPVLGLAILAAGGVDWVNRRWGARRLIVALPIIFFADLFYWNSLANPLAYARYSFADLYANRESLAGSNVASTQPPLTRFHMPDHLTAFGPLNHPLDLSLEATYGYNPLELRTYAEYKSAAAGNRALLKGLNVSRYLDTSAKAVVETKDLLPRAYFAKRVLSAANRGESERLLATLDPAESAIVTGAERASQIDPSATVLETAADGEQGYRIRYRASAPALLKISVPFFPGWIAMVGGQPCNVLRVDHALMGIVAPAGEHELRLRFHSTYFALGALFSGLTLAACVGILLWVGVKRREQQPGKMARRPTGFGP